MSFEELLDQALALLRRRGRVTYRTLKLQFDLDDDHLDALKEELLYSQSQVRDEDGRGLVRTGDTSPTATSSPVTRESPRARAPRQPRPFATAHTALEKSRAVFKTAPERAMPGTCTAPGATGVA
jgi:hypothetical protein